MKKSGKIALCGVFSALAVVCMILTIIPVATFLMPALAGIILMPIAKELGIRWGLGAYIVSCLIAFLVTPDVEAKVLFITFFGYYPILKLIIDQYLQKVVKWVCKFAIFNASMILSYLFLLFVLGIPMDSFEIFGYTVPWVFLLVGNVVFVLLDRSIDVCLYFYEKRLHTLFLKIFK